MNDPKTQVELLIEKAANAGRSEDAMRFSQAACNAANAMCAIWHAERMRMTPDPNDTGRFQQQVT